VTNVKVVILKENYPNNKLTDEQELIFQQIENSASQNLQERTTTP
jgi:hypothetical protein